MTTHSGGRPFDGLALASAAKDFFSFPVLRSSDLFRRPKPTLAVSHGGREGIEGRATGLRAITA